jgi:serine/threonine-protein kinase RsbW
MAPFHDLIEAAMRRLQYSPGEIHGVRLALEEAIINGIRHGNKFDPLKCVRVGYLLRADTLFFAVQDEGAGLIT